MAKRVLVVTFDVVGPMMAGPGIRAWEFARVLGTHFPTTLAAPTPVPDTAPGFTLASVPVGAGAMERIGELIETHDIVIAQMLPVDVLTPHVWHDKYLMVDLYCPWMIENLEHYRAEGRETSDADWLAHDLDMVRRLTAFGDYFFCAGERQRAFWLGTLTLQGRLNEAMYARDADGRALIDVVPFGVPEASPTKSANVLKGVIPGIGENDFVALWGGGLWNWLDPLTLVRATALLRDRGYPIRAFFPGTKRPQATTLDVTHPSMVAITRALSDELGLTDTHVFFGDWVPYKDWYNYLMEADAGLSLHMPTLETRFAFRTRVLDYLRAGLVPVVNDGDTIADLLKEHDAGVVTPIGDAPALADALAALMDAPDERARLATRAHTLAATYTWERVAAPLVAFCEHPVKGAPYADGETHLYEELAKFRHTLKDTSEYATRLEDEIARKDAYIAGLETQAAEGKPQGGPRALARRVSVRTMIARLSRPVGSEGG